MFLRYSVNHIYRTALAENTFRLHGEQCQFSYCFGQEMLKAFALHTPHVSRCLGLQRRLLESESMSHDQLGVVVLREEGGISSGHPNARGKISSQYDRAERLSVTLFRHFDAVSGPTGYFLLGSRLPLLLRVSRAQPIGSECCGRVNQPVLKTKSRRKLKASGPESRNDR